MMILDLIDVRLPQKLFDADLFYFLMYFSLAVMTPLWASYRLTFSADRFSSKFKRRKKRP